MKRIAMTILMLASAAALFANGAQETEYEPEWNPVELTGTISIVDDYPVLTVGRETYLLGAPRAAWYLDEIEEGQTITIRGQLVADPFVEVDIETDGHIAVAQAVVDGEVYAIGMRFAGGPGTAGRAIAGRGMAHGRGMAPGGMRAPGGTWAPGEPDGRFDPRGRFDSRGGRW